MIEITDDMENKLNAAADFWKKNYYDASKNSSKLQKYFDFWCKELYGIKVTVEEHSTTLGHRWCQWDKVEILDDEKYTWFLLKF